MAKISLQGASIVTLVQGNSPSMFSEKFLSHHEIFSDLEVKEATVLPPLSQIKFEDDYFFQAVDNRNKFEKLFPDDIPLEEGFKLEDHENINQAATKFFKAVPYLDYYAFGINFKLKILDFTIESLVNDKLKPYTTNSVKVSSSEDGYKANINFQKLGDDISLVEINMHHDLNNIPKEGIVERLEELVNKRTKYLDNQLSKLKELL